MRPSVPPPVRPASTVDIGIPAFGRPAYVVEAVESVLAQTHSSWRLVVHENGPGGGEIAAAIEPYLVDSRISFVATGTVIRPEENWSRAIQMGEAPYVALLHDDDRWDPGFLARRVAMLDEHPRCALAFGAAELIDGGGNVTDCSQIFLSEGVHEPADFVPLLYRHNMIGPPTILVRRSAYETVGPSFDGRFIFFDYEMWFRMALKAPIAYLARHDAQYRLHDNKMTYNLRHWGEDWLNFLEHAEAMLARELPGLRLDPDVRRRRWSHALLSAALDALEQGAPRTAITYLRRGLRVRPLAVLDLRVPGALAALALGESGRRGTSRARFFIHRHAIRTHVRELSR
jgi:glycosyltransferase involved in cell wall biosynthesis